MHIDVFMTGVFIGFILMTSLYNMLLYYYNRERYFLYYALMQVGIIGVLLYDIGLAQSLHPSQTVESKIYAYLSLFALFFIVLFAKTFLRTRSYLPKHDSVLQVVFILIIGDILYYPYTFIFEYGLYIFIFLYVVYLGWLRIRQGDKAARFYMIGWLLFFLSNIIDFCDEPHLSILACNPMIVGTVAEAIMLALALSYKIKELKQEQYDQEQILMQQSKLASMGEMLGNIAHQWRQPLTRLSYIFMNLEATKDDKDHVKLLEEGAAQLEYMSQTVEDFINFFAPKKEKELFSLSDLTQETITFAAHLSIDICLKNIEDTELFTYKNELRQVLLNLLSNAKEALLEHMIRAPQIIVTVEKNKITISDNAGGIPPERINQIFEPYFSTKEKGLGVGLYMSKIIVEKHLQGKLSVKNGSEGAIFTIEFER